MADEFAIRKSAIARSLQAKTEQVPDWRVKTTLQRSIQILKRHRDIAFGDDADRPISIIITTLAAHAYGGNGDLFSVLRHIVNGMPDHIERRDGVWWVPNPVQLEENFADRWNTHQERYRKFLEWLDQVRADLISLEEAREPTIAVTRLAESLGREHVGKVAATLGLQVKAKKATDSGHTRTRDPGEQFIEDLGFAMNPTYDLAIDCIVKPKSGFRDGLLRLFGNKVQQLRQLEFLVTRCDVPENYDIYWKIKNTGAEAKAAGDLRGEITIGSRRKTEHTKYKGDHYAECYVVKNGTCVAVARHPVTIV
jgi:hypothetical protein